MIRYFAEHPTAANLMMVAFLLAGVFALPDLRRETFPDFTSKEVQVRIVYPGAAADEVEEAICQRVEDAVDGVTYVREVRSEAREGLGTVTVEMQEVGDIRTFLDDIRTEVEAIDDFPAEIEPPVIERLGRTDAVVSIAVTGPMPAGDLKTVCERLKDRLVALPEISLVKLDGFSDRQIRVSVPAWVTHQHGLSVSDIAQTIRSQSLDLPAGSLETRDRDILVRFRDERRTPRELADLVMIGGASGAELRLGDLATIEDVFEQDEEKILFDGERAGLLRIEKTKAEDALTAVDAVQSFLDRERRRSPPGVLFTVTQDVSSIVRDRLDMLVVNGVQGLVLVFLTLWLFFSLRFSFWVTAGLPVAFLGALFFLPPLGQSINMMTMVALLLALGLLMDDAIVLSENVATHLRRGRTPLQAAIEGVGEVKAGVLASFATTICIFAPLTRLSGRIGDVLEVLPVVLILVLAVSLVEAFWILPHHLAHALREKDARPTGRLRRFIDDRLEGVRERFGQLAAHAVARPGLAVAIALALMIVAIGTVAGGRLKFQAFPEIDGDVIVARLLLPQGTPLAITEARVARLTEALATVDRELTPRQPGGEALVRHVSVQFNQNSDAFETGPHVATVNVDLLTAERRTSSIDEILQRWRREVGALPDVIALRFTEPSLGPAGLPIEIRLQGDDFAELQGISREVQGWLGERAGVLDLMDDLRPGKPEVAVRLREGAKRLGMTSSVVADQLRSAFYGTTASEIQVGPEAYEIDVRSAPFDQDSLSDLEDLYVTTPTGRVLPLSSVATWEETRGWARIARVDGRRTVTVRGEIDTRITNSAELLAELRAELLPGLEERNPNLRVTFEGEARESSTTQKSMRTAFLIGITAVFLLLSFQFRSLVEPLLVMSAIPFALVGVIGGHLLMGLSLSMPSVLGLISLMGVVVNDSILLVEFVKRRQAEGLDLATAAAQASRDRFRAVLLTSLTTMAGLLPLLAERSLQAQVLIPLAISIVFGILASTLFVLLVLPAIYGLLARWRGESAPSR